MAQDNPKSSDEMTNIMEKMELHLGQVAQQWAVYIRAGLQRAVNSYEASS